MDEYPRDLCLMWVNQDEEERVQDRLGAGGII